VKSTTRHSPSFQQVPNPVSEYGWHYAMRRKVRCLLSLTTREFERFQGRCIGPLANFLSAYTWSQFDLPESAWGHIKNAEICNDPAYNACTRKRQKAMSKDPGKTLSGVCSMTTTTRLIPATRSIASPLPLTIFPGKLSWRGRPFPKPECHPIRPDRCGRCGLLQRSLRSKNNWPRGVR
jgi:hypothetical protein